MELLVAAKSALLQALVEGPGYGLELIDRVKDRTSGDVRLGQGSVYPALRSLEVEGLVRSYEGPPLPERGGRPRVYYELTGEGLRAAREQRRAAAGLFMLTPREA